MTSLHKCKVLLLTMIIFISTFPPHLHIMQFQTNQPVIANFLFIQFFVIWNSIFIYRWTPAPKLPRQPQFYHFKLLQVISNLAKDFCMFIFTSASLLSPQHQCVHWPDGHVLHPTLARTFCSGREFVNLRNIIYKWVIGGKNKQLIINSMLLMRSGHATGS